MTIEQYRDYKQIERLESTICNSNCKYWSFPHLETACILSDTFSVKKGCECYTFKMKKDK